MVKQVERGRVFEAPEAVTQQQVSAFYERKTENKTRQGLA